MSSVIDADFQAMLAAQERALGGQPAPDINLLPAALVRGGYKMQRQAQDTRAPAEVAARDLSVDGAQGQIVARLYMPPGAATPSGLLVYFHGGGFVIGDLDTHDGHCRRLAAGSGSRVLSVDYRLAPEHPFPAGHDDALAATRWAFDHAAELGADPARIAVGGDSAGGNLAASIALDLKDDPARRLAFQLLLYPGVWPREETASRKALDGPILTRAALAWFDRHLAAIGHPQAHRAMIETRDLSGAPPALVVTAGFDPLKDEGRAYAERLEAAGVPVTQLHYPSLIHDFYTMPDVSPKVLEVVGETVNVLRAAIGG